MSCVRIQTGATEALDVFAVNASGNPLTGLTDLYVRIRRQSDGYFLDWNDMTFKNSGWTTINGILSEVSATYAAGLYSRSLNTSSITNPASNDTYEIIPVQTPGTTARLPGPGELKVGQFVDNINATISSRSTLDGTGVQSAMTSQGYTTTRAPYLDNLDATVSSRAAPGAAMDLVADAVDAAALAASAVTEIQSSIISDATPFAGANVAAILADTAAIDGRLPTDPADESLQQASHTATQAAITALNDLSQADVQSAMTAQGYTATRGGYLDNLDAAISSRAAPGAAMDLVTDAVDAAALAATAVTEIQSAILSDATPFAGANVAAILADTAAIDSRLPTDPADESLQQASHTATQSAISALNDLSQADVQAAMTAQGYTTTRAPYLDNLDATVSSRSTLTSAQAADAIWDELLSGHTIVGSAGEYLANAGGGSSPADIADAVWDELLSGHTTVGSAGKALDDASSGGDPLAIADAVWDELLSGHTASGTAGEAEGRLDAAITTRAAPGAAMALTTGAITAAAVTTAGADVVRDRILSDSIAFQGARIDAAISSRSTLDGAGVQSAMTTQGYTTTRAGKLDNLDAAVTSRAAPGAAMDLVTDAVDAAALAATAVTEIQSAILSDATPFAGANVAAILADTAAMDSRLPSDPADESLQQAAHTATQAAIAGLNDLSGADVQAAMTSQGYTTTRAPKIDNLDATVSSRSTLTGAQSADAIWDELLSGHMIVGSAGEYLANAGGGSTPADIADAVWDELLSGHTAVGSAGKALNDAGAGGDPGMIADAVWDEVLAGHLTPGSTGEGLDAAREGGETVQKIDEAPTTWPPVAGSLLDRITNADGSQTYDPSTDSLEALRNRIG